ncbi:response regulator [Effusibacillus consociatus]|uniref:Response regulator n=1 Tax=Effusibacillus consociatus TaxID=1117041 RepID=A0ABV9Q0S8_9BACL
MDNLIKVLLVEDDPFWNECLADYIKREKDIELVATATTREEAILIAKDTKLDVVLMDIMLSENNLDGIDAAMEILSINNTKIIMLTNLTESEVVVEAFTAGAFNYLLKTNYKEIPNAIRSAYSNQSYIQSRAAEVLRNELVRMKKEERKRLLTNVEKEILKQIKQGNTIKEIAQKNYKTEQTIKNQLTKILKKLGVKSSKEAVHKAKKIELIE